jgi:hypothetical protein
LTKTSLESPSPQQALQVYARLLDGDPTAPADLAIAFLDPLTEWLEANNPRLQDPHLYATAAEDALLALIKNPRSYDPQRQTLEVYLRISAKGDLLNLVERERRHQKRRERLDVVELSPRSRKHLWDVEGDPAIVVAREQGVAGPSIVLPGLTPYEEQVLELMRDGERRTSVYAAALGITHLPGAEQRQAVKRVKDRLKKRIARSRDIHV